MPENEIFKEESQLSEYTSILLVACVQVKLSAVEVRLFFGENNTGLHWKEIFFMYGLVDTGSPTQ